MAAIEACERTKMWREELYVVFDAQDEVIQPIAHATIHQFESADFDDGAGLSWPLQPVAYVESTPPDRDDTDESVPIYITQSSPGLITLIPFATGRVTIQAIMKPISSIKYGVTGGTTYQAIQNVIPTFMADMHADLLVKGALARLMAMPGKTWTNPSMAGAHLSLFRSELDRLTTYRTTGQQRARSRTMPSWV